MDLSNKVAIVTGAARGIGKAYSTELLQLGAKVCMIDVNTDTGEQSEQELSKIYKDKVCFEACDVSDYKAFESVIQKTVEKFGRLDILINNAAIVNEHKWEKMIQVNVVGTINGIKLAFEYMGKDKGKDGGYVINTASDAGFKTYYMIPVYSSTKFAVVGATKNFGTGFFFKKHGVTVNAICPGPVATEMYQYFADVSLDPEYSRTLMKSFNPVSPSVVAKAMVQLLQDNRNGALLQVAGGPVISYVEN